MSAKRAICLVFGLAAALAAVAQTGPARWPGSGGQGLQPAREGFRVACGTVAFPCDQAAAVRLYDGSLRDRPVQLDLQPPRDAQQSLPGLKLAGKWSKQSEFALYGRWSAGSARPWTNLLGAASDPAGSYGLGVSWEFAPNTSAVLGWDNHDLRQGGIERELRATSLGLQWRY